MKHVYAYIRVSTVKQGEKGSSLQEQRAAIESYARRNGLAIIEWFEETETAAKRGRRSFTRMVSALEKGRADGVILHKIDRGARNLWDWASLQGLVDKGIEVHLAHEALDLNSRGGRLSADIQAVVATDYIRNLRDEVRKGINGRLNQGLYPFGAPLGYRNMGKAKPKEPDPMVGPLVRQAFELYATGTYSFLTLLAELHRRGLRNRNGGAVSKNGLTRILNNPFYMGVVRVHRRGEIFQGIHEPIVSKELFDRVHAVLTGKVHAKLRVHHFLFRRLITCVRCGRMLSGEHQKTYTYYRCHSPACRRTAAREEVVDQAIRAVLALIRFSPEEMAALGPLIEELRADWGTKIEAQNAGVNLSLSKVNTRLNSLTDAYIDGVIDRDAFEARKGALVLERKSLEEKLSRLASESEKIPDRVVDFFELVQSALLSYEAGNDAGKREILKSTTSNLRVDRKKALVELRNPFRVIVEYHLVTSGEHQRDRIRTGVSRLKALFESVVEQVSLSAATTHDV